MTLGKNNQIPLVSSLGQVPIVSVIYSTERAFAALKTDGSVVTWGNSQYGGASSDVSNNLTSGVTAIYASDRNFAALKSDGSVVTWHPTRGGAGNSSDVSNNLTSGVSVIYGNVEAFAALKTDGSVVTWGSFQFGGSTSWSGTFVPTPATPSPNELTSGVTAIYSTYSGAFAALKDDGSVITWGYIRDGGDSSDVSNNLTSGVSMIYSNYWAFAALKPDGQGTGGHSVITWGSSDNGGDSSSVSSLLSSGVSSIYSTNSAFAALKTDGSIVTWGDSNYV